MTNNNENLEDWENPWTYKAGEYTSLGFIVIPVHTISPDRKCSCGNPKCHSPGKHPMIKEWQKIKENKNLVEWGKKYPNANWGIVTGSISNLIVLDVDSKSGGIASLERLLSKNGLDRSAMHKFGKVNTGGGGMHFYFEYPQHIKINNMVKMNGYPGLDVRSSNGFVVAPDSTHRSGNKYSWERRTITALPTWLLNEMVSNSKKETNNIVVKTNDNGMIEEGCRENTIFNFSRALLQSGLPYEASKKMIQYLSQELCDPPYPLDEAIQRLDNAEKYIHEPNEFLPRAIPKTNIDMFYGVLGRIVSKIKPHTEADPIAIYTQLLATAGNYIGRNSFYIVERTKHYPNLFVGIVGNTSKGRKGTSLGHVKHIVDQIDEFFMETHTFSGLRSGEALGSKLESIPNKKCICIESELSMILRLLDGNGCLISPILRQAWDGSSIEITTKHSPIRIPDAHISVIGHITKEEFGKNLSETEIANGFGNRFLWIFSQRSQFLPHGGNIDSVDFKDEIAELKLGLDFGIQGHKISMDDEASSYWSDIYTDINMTDKVGMYDLLTAREEAYIIRIAMILAILDKSPFIKVCHLFHSQNLVEYSKSTVKYLVGESSGDKKADKILDALRRASINGLSEAEITGIFSNNISADKKKAILQSLVDRRLIFATKEGNRTVWRCN